MEISNEYAAGFFDGEGSVYAATRRASPCLMVCCSQVELSVLEMHKEQWGGSIHARKKHERWQLQHQWVLAPKNAIKFLNDIQPFVIVKKDVVAAGLMLGHYMSIPRNERFTYEVKFNGKRKYTSPTLKPEIKERVEFWHNEIRRLNCKAKPVHPNRAYTLT